MSVNQEAIYADYILGRFRLGYDYLAAFLASTLFERIINRKLVSQNPALFCKISQEKDESLSSKINMLSKETLQNDATLQFHVFRANDIKKVKSKLHEFKSLRNDLIHANENLDRLMLSETRKSRLCELVLYVVAETNPVYFAENLQHINKPKISHLREAIDETTADYLVREIDETMIRRYDRTLTREKNKQYFTKIEANDFDDLFAMRNKLIYLRNDIRRRFHESEEFYLRRMKLPVISTIDTTSGYIWMPIIHDMKHLAEVERPNIVMPSVSIVATPMNIQIYLGFGGKTIKPRLRYLDFISEKNSYFSDFIDELNVEDRETMKFFDTSWYSFVTEQRPVVKKSGVVNRHPKLITNYRKELQSLVESGGIATGGKLFCGFVLDRKSCGEDGFHRDTLFHKIEVMLGLYHRFLKYSFPFD